MNNLIQYYKNIILSEDPLSLSDSDSEFERYSSLITILKGCEEFTLDLNGIIIGSNLEAVNITGHEEWEVIGKHISLFYTAEDQLRGQPQLDLEKTERRGVLIISGLKVKKRNTRFWAKMKFRTLLSKEGAHIGYKISLQDATHKAVTNHRIRKMKDEYLSLFNNSFVGIFKFNFPDGGMLMINEKAVRIIDPVMKEKKLTRFAEIFHSEEDFQNFTQQLAKNKRIEDFEFKLKNTDHWVMVSCRYFQNEDFAEGVIVDITDIKRNNQELHRLHYELDQFIYHASHELRSPLSSMLGIVNLIELDKSKEMIISHTQLLRQKINFLDDLLKNIVAIALNNNSKVLNEEISWQAFLSSILKEFDMPASRVEMSFAVQQQLPFRSDTARLRIVLRNLISNSLRYFNPSLEKSWGHIDVNVREDGALLKISDNGTGISPDYQREIFKMFYKANMQGKGHGLGLYIVKIMVERLGGSIELDTVVDRGTTFTLFIPNLAMAASGMPGNRPVL